MFRDSVNVFFWSLRDLCGLMRALAFRLALDVVVAGSDALNAPDRLSVECCVDMMGFG